MFFTFVAFFSYEKILIFLYEKKFIQIIINLIILKMLKNIVKFILDNKYLITLGPGVPINPFSPFSPTSPKI